MSEGSPFDVFDTPLTPRIVIEASAGSGKTWVLTGLYIRLLLEQDLTVDRILMLTFTTLATKELKDRVQKKLRESLQVLEQGGTESADPFLKRLAGRYAERSDAAERLRSALAEFDRSVITTIHGFCHQVLTEEPLMAGSPFRFELETDGQGVRQAVRDVWRRWVHRLEADDTGRIMLEYIDGTFDHFDHLSRMVEDFRSHQHAEIELPELRDPEALAGEIVSIYREIRSAWLTERGEIEEVIRSSDVHKGHVTNNLPKRFAKLDLWLEQETLTKPDENLTKVIGQFTEGYLAEKTKKKGETPRHPVFALFGQLQERLDRSGELSALLLHRFLTEAAAERDRLMDESARMDYQDLLHRVRTVFDDPARGDMLAGWLRERFPFALVDEFQDTDTDQYEIFRSIWPREGAGHGLVMVGDPKQAIYSFRGGDIYTYLRALEETPESCRYSLPFNFRSRPSMVEATNEFFKPSHGAPFLERSIRFSGTRSGVSERESDYNIDGHVPPPVTVCSPCDEPGDLTAEEALWQEMAGQVADLLASGRRGEATIGGRPLEGSDIAVLVLTHNQAKTARRELARFGVRSVGSQRDTIFRSREAELLIRLLRAVINPASSVAIRDLVGSGLFGSDLRQLHRQTGSDEWWASIREELEALNAIWSARGCYPMVRRFLVTERRLVEMAWWGSRERVLTNIEHLTELISAKEQESGLAPSGILAWLERTCREDGRTDQETLYLESDESLVRVLTIHASKGLEFPVVFCPGLWYAKSDKKRPLMVRLHEPAPPFDSRIRFGCHGTDVMKGDYERSRFEDVSEEVRKCYVAVTRAIYECRIFLHAGEASLYSGLSAIFRGPEQIAEDISKSRKVKESKVSESGGDGKKGDGGESGNVDPAELWEPIHALCRTRPHLFRQANYPLMPRMVQTDGAGTGQDDADGGPISVRPYRGPQHLRPAISRFNFTALSRHTTEGAEGRDYDQFHFIPQADGEIPAFTRDTKTEDGERTIYRFPGGVRSGTFIHKLFEHREFAFTDSRNYPAIVEEVSHRHGVDPEWKEVLVGMMRSVAEADYGPLDLSGVAPADMLQEMEFNFPSREVPAESLLRIIREGAGPDEVQTGDLNGLMNGFVDLVVRFGGRYYILDYKSNDLGDNPEAYHPEALKRAMTASGYDLQYHIYLSALVRYLRWRDPDFRYEESVGGVYYLFIRGMKSGSGNGIYYDLPPWQRMQRLEKIWNGEERP